MIRADTRRYEMVRNDKTCDSRRRSVDSDGLLIRDEERDSNDQNRCCYELKCVLNVSCRDAITSHGIRTFHSAHSAMHAF
jgi:hypothetical protein